MSGTIRAARRGDAIVVIEIDAPPANAFDAPTLEQLLHELRAAEADLSVRVVVLIGKGDHFCAGANLRDPQGEGALKGPFTSVLELIQSMRVPVIAAVHGASAGGGLELALVCDIRIASHEAYFIAAGVNVGLMASVYLLPRLIGIGPAKAMLLTGLKTNADTALRYGLVTEVCDREVLHSRALELAERVATRAPLSVEASKRMIANAFDFTPSEAAAAFAAELPALIQSADHAKAIASFARREVPVFSRE